MSHYADYVKERTYDEIIETDYGFATYRWIEEGRAVYIVDIYVAPDYREKGYASELADRIAEIAKKKGCTFMLGTIQPSAKGSTIGLKALTGYGMALQSAANDVIILRKDI